MRRWAQVAAVAVVAGLLGLLVWDLAHTSGGGVAKDVDSGKQVTAPNWTRPRLDTDGQLSLASTNGKVRVLNFWASWCVPCAEEAPALEAAAQRWSKQGVVFIGINGQDLRGKALAFIDKHEITYPNVVDSGRLSGRYGVTGYPETFFVDADGTVTGHIISRVSQKELDQEIRKALRQ
jgi:cytochrome c biogenesis protein CcmG/thiol:disulfide interchange protein DsbE